MSVLTEGGSMSVLTEGGSMSVLTEGGSMSVLTEGGVCVYSHLRTARCHFILSKSSIKINTIPSCSSYILHVF